MTHEKIIKRDDGSRVKIVVWLTSPYYGANFEWKFQCLRCEKGKRTWKGGRNEDSYTWRKMSAEERDEQRRRLSLLLASEFEIREAMQELISKIVPVI